MTSEIKVLYIPGYRYPASLDEPLMCGDLRYSFNLTRALARAGAVVNVVSRASSCDPIKAELNGVVIHRYKSELDRLFGSSFDISLNRYQCFKGLLGLSNLIISHSPLSLELLKKIDLPLIYVCSGLEDIKNYSYSFKEFFGLVGIKLLRDPFKRLTWKRSHLVNTTAEAEDKTLLRFGVPAEKITTIGPGVEVARYYPRPSAEVERKRRELGVNGKVILMVGRFSPAKGHMETLEGFRKLKERVTNVSLIIVGVQHTHSPNYFLQVKKRISELRLESHVVIRENVPEKELPVYYSLADVSSVFSKMYDPLPTVIIESMSCGTPVVSTYYQEREQMILDGVDGMFVEEGDTDAWCESIAVILDDESLNERIANSALDKIRSAFNMDIVARRYLELARELVNYDTEV